MLRTGEFCCSRYAWLSRGDGGGRRLQYIGDYMYWSERGVEYCLRCCLIGVVVDIVVVVVIVVVVSCSPLEWPSLAGRDDECELAMRSRSFPSRHLPRQILPRAPLAALALALSLAFALSLALALALASEIPPTAQTPPVQLSRRAADNSSSSSNNTNNNNNNATASAASPAPIAFPPSQHWDGVDGEWSSFTLRVGTPAQVVRTFVSFASYQTWVVLPQGCSLAADQAECVAARGGTYDNHTSSTFVPRGIYDLWVAKNLGYEGNALYGYDTVALGGGDDDGDGDGGDGHGGGGGGGPSIEHTVVGALAVEDFYLGLFGINPKPTNFTSYDDGSPSYMTLLKLHNYIPSISFGYTAGAKYRQRHTGVPASLTLGGYDASRFVDNNVTFVFAADNERDLVVGIQSIQTTTTTSSSSTPTELLPDPVYAYIDCTVPEIWLPIDACQVFENEFGLVYDNVSQLYTVNDTLHDALVERNASITFNLAQGVSGGQLVPITLPYASFDLTAKPPFKGLENSTRYFPLQRAQNSSQYTLGRTFMQEAYISVDWESARFNLSQVLWDQTAQPNLVPILSRSNASEHAPASSPGDDSSSSLTTGAIVGVAVGAVAAVVLIGVLLLFWLRRKRQAAAAAAAAAHQAARGNLEDDTSSGTPVGLRRSDSDHGKSELAGSTSYSENKRLLSTVPDMSTPGASEPSSTPSAGEGTYSSSQSGALFSPVSAVISEADGRERHVFEMAGDLPPIREKDGKALTEKEALQHREQVYNGINSTTPTSSQPSREGVRQPRRINPEDVVDTGQSVKPRDELTHGRFSFDGGTGEQLSP